MTANGRIRFSFAINFSLIVQPCTRRQNFSLVLIESVCRLQTKGYHPKHFKLSIIRWKTLWEKEKNAGNEKEKMLVTSIFLLFSLCFQNTLSSGALKMAFYGIELSTLPLTLTHTYAYITGIWNKIFYISSAVPNLIPWD